MTRFAFLSVLLAVFVLAIPAFAQDDPGTPVTAAKLDFNLLWKGAIAGLIAAVLRFISKAKNPKEFDWKYALLYSVLGVIAGAYAAWRGLEVDNVLTYFETSGIVVVLWLLIKGGKEALPQAIPAILKIIMGKKADVPTDPPKPPEPPKPDEPSSPSS